MARGSFSRLALKTAGLERRSTWRPRAKNCVCCSYFVFLIAVGREEVCRMAPLQLRESSALGIRHRIDAKTLQLLGWNSHCITLLTTARTDLFGVGRALYPSLL